MRRHFQGLNALRFYAALSVVVQHIMHSPTDWFGDKPLPEGINLFFLSSNDAVDLFFVLSGFLIFYLLLAERESTGFVHVPRFYLRRVLRIWPVYFAVIGMAVIVLPLLVPGIASPFAARPALALLLLTFLGNFAFVLYMPFPPLEHLWSIAIEEQFYLIAPHLMKLRVHLWKILLVGLLAYWVLRIFAEMSLPPAISAFLLLMRYDYIAIGGLFACALYMQSPLLKLIYHPVAGIAALAVFVGLVIFAPNTLNHPPLYVFGTGIVYGVLLLNISTNERFFLRLNQSALEYGGKLTYGIYMYHPLILLVFRSLFYGKMDFGVYQVVIYPVVITLTLAVAWLSYRTFETGFLNLKDRYKPGVTPSPVPSLAPQESASR